MKKFESGQNVPYGVYLNLRHLDMQLVNGDNEVLQGKSETSYLRLPTPLVLAAAPVLGAMFVMALPVLVFASIGNGLWQGIARRTQAWAQKNAHLADVRWEPAASYLHRDSNQDVDATSSAEKDVAALNELDAEVKARREQEKS